MSHLQAPRWILHRKEPDAAVAALLVRMRRRLYPETLPVLASYWWKTVCSAGHNRAWWLQLQAAMDRALHAEPLDPLSRDILLSVRDWTARALRAGGDQPFPRRRVEPPFRGLPPEHLVPHIVRLLNEWLPAEVACLLTDQDGSASEDDTGIPALAIAKAFERLLVRERLSPETLEGFLAIGFLSPKLVYPADVEILRDVVLALLGQVAAPDPPVLAAMLLAADVESALPADYDEALHRATLEQSDGRDEFHVPITDADALRILSHDPVRIGSVVVTSDGRAWLSYGLYRGDQNTITYRPVARLRIDSTADHARLAAPWPERPSSWDGALPERGPFELFGREWRVSSWEIDGESTVLHLTFSRILPIAEPAPRAAADGGLRPAYVEMAWSELERALAEAVSRNSENAIEQMRRGELIPLGRTLYALAESLQGNWRWNSQQLEQQLRAVRYHHASVSLAYGPAPWRILPPALQAALAGSRAAPIAAMLLDGVFSEVPKPSQAA